MSRRCAAGWQKTVSLVSNHLFHNRRSKLLFIEIQNTVVICYFPSGILTTSRMLESINFSCHQMTTEFLKISTVGKAADFKAEAELPLKIWRGVFTKFWTIITADIFEYKSKLKYHDQKIFWKFYLQWNREAAFPFSQNFGPRCSQVA